MNALRIIGSAFVGRKLKIEGETYRIISAQVQHSISGSYLYLQALDQQGHEIFLGPDKLEKLEEDFS